MTFLCAISYRGIALAAPAGITSSRVILLEFRSMLTCAEQREESSVAHWSSKPEISTSPFLRRVRLFCFRAADSDHHCYVLIIFTERFFSCLDNHLHCWMGEITASAHPSVRSSYSVQFHRQSKEPPDQFSWRWNRKEQQLFPVEKPEHDWVWYFTKQMRDRLSKWVVI